MFSTFTVYSLCRNTIHQHEITIIKTQTHVSNFIEIQYAVDEMCRHDAPGARLATRSPRGRRKVNHCTHSRNLTRDFLCTAPPKYESFMHDLGRRVHATGFIIR